MIGTMCIFYNYLEANPVDETLDESNEEEICLGDVMVGANEGEDKEASNSSIISKAMEGIFKINLYFYIKLFKIFWKLKYEISFDFFYIHEPISGMNNGGQLYNFNNYFFYQLSYSG